jgi:hypothetical protein
MNNPKTQAKLDTRHRTKSYKANNTIQTTKRMSNTQTPSNTQKNQQGSRFSAGLSMYHVWSKSIEEC